MMIHKAINENISILIRTDYEHKFMIVDPILKNDELVAVIDYETGSTKFKKGCGKKYNETPFLDPIDFLNNFGFSTYSNGIKINIGLGETYKNFPPDIV